MPNVQIDSSNPPLIRQGKVNNKFVPTYEIKNDDPDNSAFLRILNADQQEFEFSVSITDDLKTGWYPVITSMIACRTAPFVLPPNHYAKITVLVVGNDNPDHAYTIPIQTEADQIPKEKCYVINKDGISHGY